MDEQEIYLLITRYLSKQTSTDENEQLADWIASAPEHEQEFESIKSVWQAGKFQVDDTETLAALKRAKAKFNIAEVSADQPANPRKYKVMYPLAAAFFILLMIAAGRFFFTHKDVMPRVESIAYLERKTSTKEKVKFALADGTMVFLAPESSLRYPAKFGTSERKVFLSGEAFFEVKHDTLRPFLVKSDLLTTRVLGTSFNIEAFNNGADLRISLTRGKVEVFNSNQPGIKYRLSPGQQLSMDRKSNQLYRTSFNTEEVCGWMTNKLVFRNVKLSDAAVKIERLYGVKIVFTDRLVADNQLWGTFENEPLESVMEYLKLAGNLKYRKEGDIIYLTPKNH